MFFAKSIIESEFEFVIKLVVKLPLLVHAPMSQRSCFRDYSRSEFFCKNWDLFRSRRSPVSGPESQFAPPPPRRVVGTMELSSFPKSVGMSFFNLLHLIV